MEDLVRLEIDDLDDGSLSLVFRQLRILDLALAAQVCRRWRNLIRSLMKKTPSLHLRSVFRGQTRYSRG